MRVIMSGRLVVAAAVAFVLAISSPASAVIGVSAPDSTGEWLGFMNVSNLPAPDGDGAFVFGSGWGTDDLVSDFDDANGVLTLSPNVIADPNEFWYQNTTGTAPDPANPGGPGQRGNKFMDANLYIEDQMGGLSGDTVEFTYTVLSDTTTSAHSGFAFIRDFDPGYGAFVETLVPLTVGTHTISLLTIPPLDETPEQIRPVQFGFTFQGENVWSTDVAPFGSIEIEIPSSGGPTPIPGDFNGDGSVNGLDLNILSDNFGTGSGATLGTGDANDDGAVNGLDLNIVSDNFGTSLPAAAAAVPEPTSIALIALGGIAACFPARKRS